MSQFRYDVVAQPGGYVIVITPDDQAAFTLQHDAFDAAADLTRKLRFVGVSLDVRGADAARRARRVSKLASRAGWRRPAARVTRALAPATCGHPYLPQ